MYAHKGADDCPIPGPARGSWLFFHLSFSSAASMEGPECSREVLACFAQPQRPRAAWESHVSYHTQAPTVRGNMERLSFLIHPPTSLYTQVFPPGYPTWQEGGGQHMSQSWDSGSRVRSYICQNSGEARFKKING